MAIQRECISSARSRTCMAVNSQRHRGFCDSRTRPEYLSGAGNSLGIELPTGGVAIATMLLQTLGLRLEVVQLHIEQY